MNKEFVIYESAGFNDQIIELDKHEISRTNFDMHGFIGMELAEDIVLKIAKILHFNVRYAEPNYD